MVYLQPMEKMRTRQNSKQLKISDLPKTERFCLWKTEGKGMEKGYNFWALGRKKIWNYRLYCVILPPNTF